MFCVATFISSYSSLLLLMCLFLLSIEGGDMVKIAQTANIAGGQNRISQPETPVTLQFQGNKFTLSPSQLRQLTTGQPLQLQGTLGNTHPIVSFSLNIITSILWFVFF